MDELISTWEPWSWILATLGLGILATLIGAGILSVAGAWGAKRSAFANRLAQVAACAKEVAENAVRGMKTHFVVTVATLTLAGIVFGVAVSGPVLDYLHGWQEERRVTRSQEKRADLESRWEVRCAGKCLVDCEYTIERCAREAIDLASTPGRWFPTVDGPQAERHFGACLRENEIRVTQCSSLSAPCVALRQMRSDDSVYYVGLRKYNGGWHPESATSPGCPNGGIGQGLSNSGTRQMAPAPSAD